MVGGHWRGILVLLLVAGLPAIPLLPFGVALARGAPVAVGQVRFYSGNHFRGTTCAPTGTPASTFRSTVKRVYTYVTYVRWNGRHADQFRWYSPDSRLYAQDRPLPYTGHGPTADCNWLGIRGFRAAHLLGRWTFTLIVDGRVARRAYFRLTA